MAALGGADQPGLAEQIQLLREQNNLTRRDERGHKNARRRATCGNGNCGGLLGLPRSTEAAEAAIRTAPELPSMS